MKCSATSFGLIVRLSKSITRSFSQSTQLTDDAHVGKFPTDSLRNYAVHDDSLPATAAVEDFARGMTCLADWTDTDIDQFASGSPPMMTSKGSGHSVSLFREIFSISRRSCWLGNDDESG